MPLMPLKEIFDEPISPNQFRAVGIVRGVFIESKNPDSDAVVGVLVSESLGKPLETSIRPDLSAKAKSGGELVYKVYPRCDRETGVVRLFAVGVRDDNAHQTHPDQDKSKPGTDRRYSYSSDGGANDPSGRFSIRGVVKFVGTPGYRNCQKSYVIVQLKQFNKSKKKSKDLKGQKSKPMNFDLRIFGSFPIEKKDWFVDCDCVLEDGVFTAVNITPISPPKIQKRPNSNRNKFKSDNRIQRSSHPKAPSKSIRKKSQSRAS